MLDMGHSMPLLQLLQMPEAFKFDWIRTVAILCSKTIPRMNLAAQPTSGTCQPGDSRLTKIQLNIQVQCTSVTKTMR